VIIPAGFVALAIAAGAGSGTESSTDSGTAGDASSGTETSASTSTRSNDGSSKSDGKSGKVGQALTNAGTTYTVTQARATDTIGNPQLLGAKADGTFVVVSLELTNNKDETKTFTDSSAKLKTSDGKKYGTSSDAFMALADDSLLLKEIQPDLTTRGKLAFDIPPNKLSGSQLVIEDFFGNGEVTVDLGL
jgi:predicted 2-oxoglutarate/Fe(II)-dependent dioxygenase YbiX